MGFNVLFLLFYPFASVEQYPQQQNTKKKAEKGEVLQNIQNKTIQMNSLNVEFPAVIFGRKCESVMANGIS